MNIESFDIFAIMLSFFLCWAVCDKPAKPLHAFGFGAIVLFCAILGTLCGKMALAYITGGGCQ